MKVFLRSQKPSRAHGSQTRFLSRQPAERQTASRSVTVSVNRQRQSEGNMLLLLSGSTLRLHEVPDVSSG